MMKAAVYRGIGRIRIEEIPQPELPPGGFLLRIEASGVCGTDVKTYLRGHRFFQPPCILGHELAGTIVELSPEVTSFQEGDRVAVAPYVPCGFCRLCQRGCFELCQNKIGLESGVFTEYLAVPAEILARGTVKLPEGLSFASGALAEPLACILNGLEDCRLELADPLLIIGAGPMGLLGVQAALASGAGQVLISELNGDRLEKAAQLGAIPINPKQQDPREVLEKHTQGRLAQAVLVCVGSREAVQEAQQYVAPGGIINMFGGLPQDAEVTVDPALIHYHQVSLVGSFGFTHIQFQRAVQLMASGKVKGEQIISHSFPLEQAEQAILLSSEQKALKVILKSGE